MTRSLRGHKPGPPEQPSLPGERVPLLEIQFFKNFTLRGAVAQLKSMQFDFFSKFIRGLWHDKCTVIYKLSLYNTW